MSDYSHRYEHVDHKQLYDGVHAGDPTQIDGVASQWSSLKNTVDGLGRDLSGDLDKLVNTWTGEAGREFQQRLTLIVEFSARLSEGMADVRQSLSMMSDQLKTAQREAESPEATDDHDKAVGGAVKGGLIFGAPGAVIGGMLGHQQDKAEQEKAHRRMVQVVSELAAGYDLSAYGRLVSAPEPDPETPGSLHHSSSGTSSGPGASTPTDAPTTGVAGPRGGATAAHGPVTGSGADTPGVGAAGPHGGSGALAGVSGEPVGTSLAGADPLLGGALLAGAAAGAGTLAGPGATATASAGTGAGLLFGTPAGTPAGGVVGTGSLAGSGRATPTTPHRPAGAATPMENRAATGTARLAGGRAASGGTAAAGRPGAAVGPTHRSGVLGGATNRLGGGRGASDEDASDERLTWLTEDEMVWQDGAAGAPPVLGGN